MKFLITALFITLSIWTALYTMLVLVPQSVVTNSSTDAMAAGLGLTLSFFLALFSIAVAHAEKPTL